MELVRDISILIQKQHFIVIVSGSKLLHLPWHGFALDSLAQDQGIVVRTRGSCIFAGQVTVYQVRR